MYLFFRDHKFVMHHSGALLWPARKTLIASDLHLEKGSHYARRGYFLPPYDSRKTLSDLIALLESHAVARLILLGDCFHDAQGYERMGDAERALFGQLLRYAAIWVKGNHDGDFVPPGFESHDAYRAEGIVFRHEAEPGEQGEISGHFHPKADLLYKGEYLSARCFAENGNKLILPAFGAYTGGLNIKDAVFRNLFSPGARVYMTGKTRVFSFQEPGALKDA